MCFCSEGCSLVFFSLSPVHVCGDLLLMDDLSAYRKSLFSGEAGGDGCVVVMSISVSEFQSHPG